MLKTLFKKLGYVPQEMYDIMSDRQIENAKKIVQLKEQNEQLEKKRSSLNRLVDTLHGRIDDLTSHNTELVHKTVTQENELKELRNVNQQQRNRLRLTEKDKKRLHRIINELHQQVDAIQNQDNKSELEYKKLKAQLQFTLGMHSVLQNNYDKLSYLIYLPKCIRLNLLSQYQRTYLDSVENQYVRDYLQQQNNC